MEHKLTVLVHNAGLYLPGQQEAQKLGIDSPEVYPTFDSLSFTAQLVS
jgi:hypothetical protein